MKSTTADLSVKLINRSEYEIGRISSVGGELMRRTMVESDVIVTSRILHSSVEDDLLEDLLQDTHDLLYTHDSVSDTVYPHTDLQLSSVIILQDNDSFESKVSKNSDDSFLQLLQTSYRGTFNRNDLSNKLRITMIFAGGSVIHTMDFDDEKDYWLFLAGIKMALQDKGHTSTYNGKCSYVENNNSTSNKSNTKTDDKTQHRGASTSIFGLLSSAVTLTHTTANGTNTSISQRFEVTANTISVFETVSGKPVLTVDLFNVKALALTLDLPASQEMVLEVALTSSKLTNTNDQLIQPAAIGSKVNLNSFHLESVVSKSTGNNVDVNAESGNVDSIVSTVPKEVYELSPLQLLIPLSEHDVVISEQSKAAYRASVKSALSDASDVTTTDNTSAVRSVGVFGNKQIGPSLTQQVVPLSLFEVHEQHATSQNIDRNSLDNGNRLSNDRNNNSSHHTTLSQEMSPVTAKSRTASFYRPFGRSPSVPSINPNNSTEVSTSSVFSSPRKTTSSAAITTNENKATPVNSNGSYVSNGVRYNHSIFSEVQIQERTANCRAARIFIKQAQDIPSSYPKSRGVPLPPTAYCTVYLMGPNAEKLSANTAEARTEATKSFNPEWRKEILLQDPRVSMDSVTGVMILVRDAASGVLKHHHIGQVTIPINCFLYQTEADFCLPLEPSYRMREDVQQRSYIGDLHLTTQLVDVEDEAHLVDGKNQQNSASDKKSVGGTSLKVDTRSKDYYTAYLRYTLYRTVIMNTWWPMRPLVPSAGQGPYSYRRMGGHVLCGFEQIQLRLAPGAVGMLYNAKECEDGVLYLPWSAVNSAIDLTESVSLLSINFHHRISGPSSTSKSELVYAPAVIDILLGPCPAVKLCGWMTERISMDDTRQKLVKLIATSADLNGNNFRLSVGTSGGIGSPTSPVRNKGLSFAFAAPQPNSPTKSGRKFSFSQQQGDLMSTIRGLSSSLERLIKDCLAKIKRGQRYASLSNSTGDSSFRVNLGQYLARSRVYLSVLRYICRELAASDSVDSSEFPQYTLSAVKSCVEADVQDAQLFTPLRENAKPESLILRNNHFRDTAVNRIRDYILFSSATSWNSKSDGEASRECVEKLIEGYLAAFRQSLTPYIGSKEVFMSLGGGQAFKTCILRLLAENNSLFHEEITGLMSATLDIDVTPKLVLCQNVDAVIRWYATDLLFEAKKWLSRTMQQALDNRENKFGLPWDVEMGDGNVKQSSHLPETVRFQLNLYIGLCQTISSERLVSESSDIYLRINSRIVDVVATIFHMFSDEFQRALQSKHWEQGDRASGETKAFRSFLVSVMNDCHRISSIHVTETIQSVQCHQDGYGEGLAAEVRKTFSKLCAQTCGHVVRMVFTDVQSTLLELEQLWTDQHNATARILSTNITRQLTHLREGLTLDHYLRVSSSCARVVSIRYLLFLKDRASALNPKTSVAPLTSQEIARFVLDVKCVRESFEDALEREASSSDSRDESTKCSGDDISVARQLQFLDDICTMLTEKKDSALFHSTLRAVIRRYPNEYIHVAESVIVHCVSVLRPDATSDFISVVNGILSSSASHVTDANHQSMQHKLNNDLYVKVFGHDDVTTLSHHDHDHSSSEEATAAAARRPSNNAFINLFVSPKAKHGGTATTTPVIGGSAGHALKTLNPVSALKHLREKVADSTAIKGATGKRKNEEYALHLMRALGLEADHFDGDKQLTDSTDGSRNLNATFLDEDVVDNAAAAGDSSDSEDSTDGASAGGAPLTKRHSNRYALNGLSNLIKGGGTATIPDIPPDDLCVVTIKSVQVRGLQSSSVIGTANPYIKLSVGAQKTKTTVKHNSREAVWKETYELRTSHSRLEQQKLTVRVYDKERIRRKRLLGAVTIKLAGLQQRAADGYSSWYALEGGETGSTGDVHLCLSIVVPSTSNSSTVKK